MADDREHLYAFQMYEQDVEDESRKETMITTIENASNVSIQISRGIGG